jgi:hypothetical protein
MREMSEALQSAQQSLQQAGQPSAQGGDPSEASESEMGEEYQPGNSGSQQAGGSSGSGRPGSGNGGGLGGPGIGQGGSVGAQQPLPGVKKDSLVKPMVNERGQKMQRTYKGTPDPTQDRAAYYEVAPESRRAAEASLNREEIPAGYKKQVRDYFESIQPSGK